MRIISGTHKGRRLIAPKNLPVRPTTDFAKEGLFNILKNRYNFEDLNVLDLFSGTGNISYEFASRGVPKITAVDAHHGCIKYIQKITEEFDFPINSIKSDTYTFLDRIKDSYDLIFADPPYIFEREQFEKMIGKITFNNLLNMEGVFIIEHPKQTDLSLLTGFQETRNYGGSVFSFFKK